jgi:hypothetical protein
MTKPRGAVLIYETALEIRAKKGKESLFPKDYFKHSFKKSSKVKIWGLPNGDVLIKSDIGKRLWDYFNYD